jgi:hypothetical protein
MMRRALFLAAMILTTSGSALAAPLNTWGVFIGKGVFALTPYLYAGPSFGVQPWVFGEYGFNDRFELAVAGAATVAPGASFDAIEVMPRYFLDDQTGIALRTAWKAADKTVTIAPELHIVRTFGQFELTLNPTVVAVATVDGAAPGSIGGIVAPEWFFSEKCSVFVELTPDFNLEPDGGTFYDRSSFEVLPGVGFTIADIHQFSMGVGIPVLHFDPNEVYAGMWYSTTFGGEEDAEAGAAPALPEKPKA